MPTLPGTHIQQSEARGALRVDPRVGNPSEGLDEASRALALTAGLMSRRKEEDAASDAALKIATMQSNFQKEFLERQQKAEPGAPGFTENLLKDYDEYVEEMVAGGGTRYSQNFMKERAAAFRGQLSGQSSQFEYDAREAHTLQNFTTAAEISATNAELDPGAYATYMGEQLAALDVLDLSPIRKEEMRKAVADLHRGRAAVGIARKDPDVAMRRLLTPEADDQLFRSLSPKARDEVLNEIESTQRIRLQAEEREYRDAQRAESDLQDSMSKEGDKRLAEGTLSAAWIEANRGRLSADDYRYFRRALSGEGGSGPRDVQTYADLRDRASRGEDIRADARLALNNGQIRIEDHDRLFGEVESSRPGWYKRGVDFINVSGKPNELNPEEGAQQRLANMLDDWQIWADSNPKATEAEARQEYRNIVQEYDLLDTTTLSITLARPKYMVGDRNAPDLDATEAETARAFQAGEIPPDEAQRQALLIQQWRKAMERQSGQQGTTK